ncbi:MAG: SDR family oxidoreductase [Azonexus sp.]|jgi:NAD(P)-dependent dehydrogenase (short-subunit alcohol dehydrogenase family)|nr:SDR family oxidoreductase [Azonexus sp.]
MPNGLKFNSMNQPLRLDGRTIIITGASRGVGRQYARLLAQLGANLVLNSATAGGLDEVIAEIGVECAVAVTGDIGDPAVPAALVATACERFGALDAVVANAGANSGRRTVTEIDDAQLQRMLEVHLFGSWRLVREAWPRLIERDSSRIVLTTSQFALFGSRGGADYAAAKGAIFGLTRALANDAYGTKVKVNAVAPIAATDMSDATLSPEAAARFRKRAPAQFVAPLVALLVHPNCPVNGEVFNCGAGLVDRIFVAAGRGATFDIQDISAEAILTHFEQVMAEDGYLVPSRMEELNRLLPPSQ